MENDGDTNITLSQDSSSKKAREPKSKLKKKDKSGIVYLSRVPQYMNVKKLREVLSQFGETGNIFLQPDDKAPFSKKGQLFTEGWVEFKDKADAKQVALMLNNTQVGGRRKNPWYADIWNIKYLPKFKWSHLGEQRAYERAVHEQRLRTEISQVKREASFHTQSFEKSRKQRDMGDRKRKRGETVPEGKSYTFKMRTHRPDGEHGVGALSLAANKGLLQKLFSGGGAS